MKIYEDGSDKFSAEYLAYLDTLSYEVFTGKMRVAKDSSGRIGRLEFWTDGGAYFTTPLDVPDDAGVAGGGAGMEAAPRPSNHATGGVLDFECGTEPGDALRRMIATRAARDDLAKYHVREPGCWKCETQNPGYACAEHFAAARERAKKISGCRDCASRVPGYVCVEHFRPNCDSA